MTLSKVLILLFSHGIPILFFMYMLTDVLLRNRRKTEHILLSLLCFCYLMLFVEEFVRNLVPIEHSPLLSSIWLSSAGLTITSLGLHFLIKFTQLDTYFPKWLYPYIFYLPFLFVILNIISGASLMSAQQFEEAGIWYVPVYNMGYYITMTSSIGIDVIYLIILYFGKKKAKIQEQRTIYNWLIFGVFLAIFWHLIFGYINFGSVLPPYPYLYSGILWCYFLRFTMKKYDFLTLYDARYEKLFNINPDIILLIDSKRNIKNANPKAKQFIASINLNFNEFYDQLPEQFRNSITKQVPLKDYRVELNFQQEQYYFLVTVDYVLVENDVHSLIILRNITTQALQQKQIEFLAYYDPLTKIPNRRYFHEELNKALQNAEKTNEHIALYLIDIDYLKVLNDQRGHLAGDDAIASLGKILTDLSSPYGLAGRMGGDEFIVFINETKSDLRKDTFIDSVQSAYKEIIKKYGDIQSGLSIGVSYFPQAAQDIQSLINLADIEMYKMKNDQSRHIKI